MGGEHITPDEIRSKQFEIDCQFSLGKTLALAAESKVRQIRADVFSPQSRVSILIFRLR